MSAAAGVAATAAAVAAASISTTNATALQILATSGDPCPDCGPPGDVALAGFALVGIVIVVGAVVALIFGLTKRWRKPR